MSTTRSSAQTMGLAAGVASAPLAYALLRALEARISPEHDPAAMIWAEHSAMHSRLLVTGYVTAVATLGTLALARATPRHAPHVVAAFALLSALALAAQTVWLP